MREPRRLLCLWVAAQLVSGCRPPSAPLASAPPAPVTPPSAPVARAPSAERPSIAFVDDANGSLVASTPDQAPPAAGVTTAPLAPAEAERLLARLEPLPDLGATNASAPAVRPASPAPPRSGAVAPIAFAAPTGRAVSGAPIAPVTASRPLVPPQIAPLDEVSGESEVRVRFDEPMVPVAALGTAAPPPIAIAPAVPGTWRWVDTRLVQFKTTAARFPMATAFKVTVPAGVKAASGATLVEDVSAEFRTPPIAVAGITPGRVRPDGPIAVRFDQAFDRDEIAKRLRVEMKEPAPSKKRAASAFRVIELAEAKLLWARDPSLKVPDAAQLGAHHLLLAPATAWPAGRFASVTLAAGAPSSEGPRASVRESATTFEVVPPLTVKGIECNRAPIAMVAKCPAAGYLSVTFSNPIDTSAYRSSQVQIAGQPFVDATPQWATVGFMAPRTLGVRHDIAIDAELVDLYGQKLSDARRPWFTTTPEVFDPSLWGREGMYVLDPRFEIPQWVLGTEAVASVRVQLYAVQPGDYPAYAAFEEAPARTPPGKRVFDKEYTVGARMGADLRVDLRPALSSAGTGHVVAVAVAQPVRGTEVRRTRAWIQVTRLGLTTRTDGFRAHAWVHDITPRGQLAPLAAGVQILVDGKPSVAAVDVDAAGHARIELPVATPPRVTAAAAPREPTTQLVAQHAGDSTFAVVGRMERTIRVENARWYVTDDRFTYKPGEKAYVKGWVRWTDNGVNPDIALPPPGSTLDYELHDARSVKVASGQVQLSEQGGFDFEVALPPNMNLGTAMFTLATRHERKRHPISVLEFRTPTYSVGLVDDVQHAGARPLVLGERIEMSASARYYAGGGLGGASIKWEATLTPSTYRPPGWAAYSFQPPRRRRFGTNGSYDESLYDIRPVEVRQHGTLGGASTAGLALGVAALPGHRPSVLSVEATVADVDRARIRASSRPILVHPSAYYVGVRHKPGDAPVLELVVTDIDGALVGGVPIDVAVDGVLGSERYRDNAKIVDTHRCAVKSLATGPVTCSFTRADAKTAYLATARIADARGRTNAAQYAVPWSSPADTKADLAIVPDKATYRPGDVARLDIRSTVLPAIAVVTHARKGMIAQKRVELTKESTIVELPIEASYLQNVVVLVDRWGKRRRLLAGSTDPLPEHTEVHVDLDVELESARLAMTAKPRQPLVEPGAEATFDVQVMHGDKPAVDAEVALMVVDEAILALSTKKHADPLPAFYDQVSHDTHAATTMELVEDAGASLAGTPGFKTYRLDDPERLGFGRSGYGSGGGGYGMRTASVPSLRMGSVESRKDFRPNAVFAPRLRTDARGKATVTVKMPDSLTRYRIVALATHAMRNFGKGEGTIVVQRKLNARTVAPRFLSQGDRFSLPVIVQNLDSAARTVDVAVRAANLVAVGPTGARVTIPGGQRGEVRFDFATVARGTAAIQAIAASGDFADASTVLVPVYEPATTESFATYGTVEDKPSFEQLAVPGDIFADVGGVEVELASTQLQALTDAFWYLHAYPYECAEQRSARMLATSAVADLLEAFKSPGRPSAEELAAQRAKDARLLAQAQLPDGGWGYFSGMKSDPLVTMQVHTALLAQAGSPGSDRAAPGSSGGRRFDPLATTVAASRAFLVKLVDGALATLAKDAALPVARRSARDDSAGLVAIAAAALTALDARGDMAPRAEQLHGHALALDAYPIDAAMRLLRIVAKLERAKAMRGVLLARLLSATHETASSAKVATSYVEREKALLLPSSPKSTALALDALLREAPDHALVPKLARGILDARQRGRWSTTQENVVVLGALRRYFDVFEKVTPSYTGKVWLGTAAYTEQAFAGRSGTRGQARLDWHALRAGTTHDLAFVREGAGRMYYRLGITYAPSRVDLPALDAGFVVRRTYSAAEDPKDVARGADGTWRIKLGAKVLVTVETTATTARHGVAVVDPLPAGFESIDERLAISERAAPGPRTASRWDHTSLRDNRSEAFAMDLPAGIHTFAYSVRATTPGTFRAAPAKAEEMYSPETFGRSAGELVTVE